MRINRSSIPAVTIVLMLLLTGCAPLFNAAPPLVSPSSIGHEITLADLKSDLQSYDIYYSARIYNPSAILFIPHGNRDTVVPDRKWRPVQDRERLEDLLRRIRDRNWTYPQAGLRALLAPPTPEGSREFLAYIYTAGSTAARPLPEKPGAFIIRAVPEQRKHHFFREDSLFDDD